MFDSRMDFGCNIKASKVMTLSSLDGLECSARVSRQGGYPFQIDTGLVWDGVSLGFE